MAERAEIPYYCDKSSISRGAGQSSVAMAAYNRRDTMKDERADMVYSWKHEKDLVHANILAPDDTPEWVYDSETLWNACEQKENRKNSQTAHSIVMMLPRELDTAGCIAAVEAFALRELVSKGMIVDYAIQRNIAGDGNDNPHVHMLVTTRGLDSSTNDGWAKTKNREWSDNDKLIEKRAYGMRQSGMNEQADALLDTRQIIQIRRAWAGCVNKALSNCDVEGRVDHRTLVAQQRDAVGVGDIAKAIRLDREPQPYIPHYRIVKKLADIPEYVTAKLRAVNAAKLQRISTLHLSKISMRTGKDIARMVQQAQAGLARFVGRAPDQYAPSLSQVVSQGHELERITTEQRPEPQQDYEQGMDI